MEFYAGFFPALVLFNIALFLCRLQKERRERNDSTIALPSQEEAAYRFKRQYFAPYALVVAADWLQGPYLYTLYKDEKGLTESTVAALFTTGFVSAGITATFVGSRADQHGRKTACQVHCIVYSISCLTTLSTNTWVLFAGRALGGLSTTLQYSVFESWMVTEYHDRGLSSSLVLGNLFSLSVIMSNVVAIIAGVLGEGLVRFTDTKISPFMAAVVCLNAAYALIHHTWSENFGENEPEKPISGPLERLRAILADRRIIALCLNTTIFEGSMYLFVFFWAPTLISARNRSGESSPAPFGLIFSNFMCAMMLGSQTFSLLDPRGSQQAAALMLSTLALTVWAFLIPVLQHGETTTFWAFALFEACAGMYFPTMSQLKSELVEDGVRAKVYSLMRLPLNVFVAVGLGLTQEGDMHRANVFTAVAVFMLLAFWIVQRCLL